MVYEYGGGAFFTPYVLALSLVGILLLVLEIALGQYYETGGEMAQLNRISTYHVFAIKMRNLASSLLCPSFC